VTQRPPEQRTVEGLRVVLVDDHLLFRQGLRRLLQDHGVDIAGEASNGRAGARLANELRPDVVVMDLHMPQMNGIEAVREIVEADSRARVLMLTISTDDEEVLEALAAGACGYLLKTAPPEEVVRAVHAAAEGDSTVSAQVATRLIERLRDRATKPAPDSRAIGLTPRELEILRLVAEGKENSEIAAALVISASTAKNHVASVLDKLGVDNRVQAAVFAVRNGIV
jgi:DNA-binding NarL/FixJ family response regulator